MKNIVFIFLFGILKISCVKGQDIGLKVVDEQGKPIPHVDIRFAKQATVVTNGNNEIYRFPIEWLPDTLTISSIGYISAKHFIKHDSPDFTITLWSSPFEIEPISVNTGYQSVKSNEMTGAVTTIDASSVRQQTDPNILRRLSNIALGVSYDSKAPTSDLQKTNTQVRGFSTINGPVDPLIVLDGFIYEGEISQIDPNSIENITILKDAAAASIWGARAGNGVIVISTRASHVQTGVQLLSTQMWTDSPKLTDVYQLKNRDYLDLERFLFEKGYYDQQNAWYPQYALSPYVESLFKLKNGDINENSFNDIEAHLSGIDSRAQFDNYFTRQAFNSLNSIYITGREGRYSYKVGGGYTKDRSYLDANSDKVNLSLIQQWEISNRLELDVNLNHISSRDLAGFGGYDSYKIRGRSVPYLEFVDGEGVPQPIWNNYRKDYVSGLYPETYLDWGYVPLTDRQYVDNTMRKSNLFGQANLRYKVVKGFDLNFMYHRQLSRSDGNILYDVESNYARILINQFTAIDTDTRSAIRRIPVGGINDTQRMIENSYTGRLQANVDQMIFGGRLLGVLGAEMREAARSSNSFRAYGYSEDPLRNIPVDYSTTFPIDINFSSSTIPGSPQFSRFVNRFISGFSNLSYIWKDRYVLSFSARKDGANIFGANTNARWKPLWSSGIKWEVSKEDFFNFSFVDLLNLRTTYGVSGNVDLRKTPMPVASTTRQPYTLQPSLQIAELNDPNLGWEQVHTLNTGIDFSLFNGKFGGTVDYFVKNGRDLYGDTPYDYTVWGAKSFILRNVASMQSKGWEVGLHSAIKLSSIMWRGQLIFNKIRNKTVDYYRAVEQNESAFIGNGITLTPIIGKPLHGIAAYKWGGLDEQGDPQGYVGGDLSTNYVEISRDAAANGLNSNLVYFGESKPVFFGNFINTLEYNKFGINFNFSYKLGYYFRKPVTNYGTLINIGTAYEDYERRWKNPGDEVFTDVPSFLYPINSRRESFYGSSEKNVLRGDHIRLEYVNIYWSNTFDIRGKKIPIRMFLNTSNLGIVWRRNRENIDPQFIAGYRPTKSTALGASVTF